MNLYVNYYQPERGQRKREINDALRANLKNKFIEKIVILSNDLVPFEDDKIEEYPVNKIPVFSDFTELFDSDTINIICNSDISLDHTIRHAERLDNRTAYAITRHERMMGKLVKFTDFHGRQVKPEWSQDTWVFRGECKVDLPEKVLAQHLETGQHQEIPFSMGVPGCDNLMAYYLKQKYIVKNPHAQITCEHHHASLSRPSYKFRMTGARSRWGLITKVDDFGL